MTVVYAIGALALLLVLVYASVQYVDRQPTIKK